MEETEEVTRTETTAETVTAETVKNVPDAGNQQSALEAFLTDESNRTVYDAAVADAVAMALQAQKDAEAEEKRKAKLTAEERAAEKEQELEAREARLQAAERKSEAVVAFAREGMPAGLAECLNYHTKEEYEKSMAAVKTAFAEAVQAGVNERIRGKKVPAAVGDGSAKTEAAGVSFVDIIKENQAKR